MPAGFSVGTGNTNPSMVPSLLRDRRRFWLARFY